MLTVGSASPVPAEQEFPPNLMESAINEAALMIEPLPPDVISRKTAAVSRRDTDMILLNRSFISFSIVFLPDPFPDEPDCVFNAICNHVPDRFAFQFSVTSITRPD